MDKILHPRNIFEYQKKAINHQIINPDSMLWLWMGLGKTVITLTTIDYRMRSSQVEKTLIFGPLRVVHSVWENESKKWSHLDHLRFQIIHGSIKKRERQFFADADIYLINYENMAWLAGMLDHYYISQNKNIPFQMVVYDEVTKVKKSNSQRMSGGKKTIDKGKPTERQIRVTGWRKVINEFKYRTGLTGTPAPNGYEDLHGQYLAVDGGERLNEFVTHFRSNYCIQNYNGFGFTVTDLGIRQIEQQIGDITLKMDGDDYLELPDTVINDIVVHFPSEIRKQYNELEREFFVELDSNEEIEVFNKASLSNKLLQFCNGSPFLKPQEPEYYELHDLKLQALDDILEESGGNPVLVGYTFKPDAERIMRRFKRYKPINLTKTRAKDLPKALKDIQNGLHDLIIGHPASMGHGIDGLQKVCNTAVWFGLNWNLEYDLQFTGRLKRPGQKKTVIIHRLICEQSMDEIVRDALKGKNDDQTNLKEAIQRYRDKQKYDFW